MAATESDTTHESASPGDALNAWIGQTKVSDWILVDQDMINAFADATGDHSFLHVDPDQMASHPFGGTIAHGFLVMSLLPKFLLTMPSVKVPGQTMALNAGFDKLRFTNPVRSGSRLRMTMVARTVDEKAPGQFRILNDVTIEIDGHDRPALVAEWISQIFF